MYTFSIVIATKNRPHHLARGLASIRSQSIQPLEIIIVDDSDIAEMINENKSLTNKYNCIYLSSPHKGLFVNRNIGALHSSGTHIRSMDDDHEFPEDHLKRCLEAVEDEPETIWTIGEYCISEKMHAPRYSVPGQLHPRGFAHCKFKEGGYYGIADGATIFPRSVFDRKILNCELYPFGFTYLEYGTRLKYNNYMIRPLKNTYIIHHDTDKTATKVPELMQESRIFAMFCLSFKYRKSLYNKAATVFQLALDVISRRLKINTIKKAYKNYQAFTYNV